MESMKSNNSFLFQENDDTTEVEMVEIENIDE